MSYEISITQEDFGQYPLPGVNNDTQGFRDRFSVIQDKFDVLDGAVNSLDLLSAKLNQTNDFGGNSITDAILKGSGESVKTRSNLSASAESAEELQWIQYHYFPYTVTSNSYVRFTEWPLTSGMMGRITVELRNVDASSKDVVFIYGASEIKLASGSGLTLGTYGGYAGAKTTVSTNTTKIYEFWTPDKGVTLFAKLVGTFS